MEENEPIRAPQLSPSPSGEPSAGLRWQYGGVALFGLAIFIVTLTGLPNFTDNEWRISSYVLDAIQNGHWFVQTDSAADVASKPPMLTWLVSLAALPTGEVTRLALYWPSAVATILIALVLLRKGTQYFDERAGHFAAFTYLLSYAALNQMAMPRYEGLLTLAVTLGSFAAFRAWQTGSGWTMFWVISAVGTLVKGPLALLLGASGLIAVFFARGESRQLRGKQWPGVLLFLAITGGWFLLAYLQMGDPLVNKMLKRELVGHALSGSERGRQFGDFFLPLWNVLTSYAPWCVLSLVGLWRVWKQPAAGIEERNFERFLVASFLIGLAVFTVAAHQRGRLILPLIPTLALLAGRELSRWTRAIEPVRIFRLTAAACVLFVAFTVLYSHWLLKWSTSVQETIAARNLVRRVADKDGDGGEFPFTYVDNFHALQVWANTRRTVAPVQQACDLLKGETPAFVVLTKTALPLEENMDNRIHEVYRWPAQGKPKVRILSNYPRLEWPESVAMWLDGNVVQLRHARFQTADENELWVEDDESKGEILVVNHSRNDKELTVHLNRPGPDDLAWHEHLTPGIPMVMSWSWH